MEFEWDETKNKLNQTKHGISFEEAKEVFFDPLQVSKLDHKFHYFEERWVTIGTTSKHKLLVVANLFYTEDGSEIIRIISARQSDKQERSIYENT
ncbi:hypothetical protein [uncultured Gammaproteobacteria bacterium]|jgi:uncharacterized DUF497 family protein|uniref:BrnT family toxin n=1 Tax=thiotrophic endosymbiont of Bathymodiolus puteoserpentis (Logatchev) TaxID=343240 RepID=UPI0010B7A6DE|nr:BrnT family toxin [thiotrophic endosymbiont of Bathymodiolus puteoserpentis (Logatchev)]CAC9597357.1 hypothetical protein [uncultured Gammaproteobacteria bacterium]CAC9647860.1 hypothetical protein [uncultured Gammaproteobacteria bacterium]CAC9650796.1 hypothetical protein [uncultured Gammaproteobacteria bacterium]CAC9658506.1 hypothetical protein [uncultured Gammaproteobacteria bacterium]SSC10095.1 hypothetical protein BPUTEOSOX_1241 [thiotrophic endosymbiont of Bathymodiolus puteoserpenti